MESIILHTYYLIILCINIWKGVFLNKQCYNFLFLIEDINNKKIHSILIFIYFIIYLYISVLLDLFILINIKINNNYLFLVFSLFIFCLNPMIWLQYFVNKFLEKKIKMIMLNSFNHKVKIIEEELNEKCNICWDKYKINDILAELECNHFFHKKCIIEMINYNYQSSYFCPYCRNYLFN